ncbi:MAG: rhodanese-like domain-containing protein [Pseudomonadota bacterium]
MHIVSWYQFKMDMCLNRLQSLLNRFFVKHNNILGTIILALEGINVNLSGDKAKLDLLLDLLAYEGFDITTAKFHAIDKHPFHKIKILMKNEICALKNDKVLRKIHSIKGDKMHFCFDNSVKEVNAVKWNEVLADDSSLILDIRNKYEHVKGVFTGKNVLQPNVNNFHQTIEWLRSNRDLLKRYKNVGMYCTGGIRCDKLSFYLVEEGFDNLILLKGGIIKYINDMNTNQKSENIRNDGMITKSDSKDNDSINNNSNKLTNPSSKKIGNWTGDCFVFDDRIVMKY